MSWLSASHNSYIRSFVSHPQLLRPLIPSSAHGIGGGPRRFTELWAVGRGAWGERIVAGEEGVATGEGGVEP